LRYPEVPLPCPEAGVSAFEDLYYAGPARAYLEAKLGPGAGDPAERARSSGLRIHAFKRSGVLPRVAAALSSLKAFWPASVAEVGAGRGTFLWPALEALPGASFVAVEADPGRHARLAAVAASTPRLSAVHADAAALPLASGSCDACTLLEVLEHVADPAAVARECLRVARVAVVASVPSHPDSNPEHLRLFTRQSLADLLAGAGAARVSLREVPGHLVAVATAPAGRA
jgi:SAM-dependent methyltransferase